MREVGPWFLRLCFGLLTFCVPLHTFGLLALTGEDRETRVMKAKTKLRMPLSAFLMDVDQVAAALTRHAKRLSAVSGGRIGARTAKEMLRLGDELRRIEVKRPLIAIPAVRPLVREALKVISEIRAAARYVAATDLALAEELARISSGTATAATAAVVLSLETHLRLLSGHVPVATLAREDTAGRAERLIEALRTHDAIVRERREAAMVLTLHRDTALQQLDQLVRESRALAAVVFHHQPALAAEFAAARAAGKIRRSGSRLALI